VKRLILAVLVGFLGGCAATHTTEAAASHPSANHPSGAPQMKLGNFSVSLAVKDIAASRAFYEKLGFKQVAGDQAKNWLILQNDSSTIGLFQGMFPRNTLTYNPGWDRSMQTPPDFDDVRDIQRMLKSRGLTLVTAADESTTGPASLMLMDPDGNPILIDQHVPSPRK
jgi:catechol 2,3-dioxygenase-like lactoylglutathione lyase family enzyme